MGEKFKNKYNTGTIRLKGFDYSADGGYFVTICTKNREEYFGKIIDGKMILNDDGRIIENEIINTGIIRDNVIIDEYVVMPDHFHMVLMIGYSRNHRDAINRVSTITGTMITTTGGINGGITGIYNPMLNPNVLGNIIRQFKGKCTFLINKSKQNNHFAWQSNYYEHIIRDENELYRIKKYIIENPLNWESNKKNARKYIHVDVLHASHLHDQNYL
ncbi:MAG: hypothetical protein PHS92_05295 [Candidatus Gracilibacteria bacterium]|nr:hypothetical protein [Candidatus Gracilibacteria bacterium]